MSDSKVTLACEVCKDKNYRVNKSSVERLVIKKYCKRCNLHTEHKEEK